MTLQPKPSRHQTSQPAFFNQDFVNLLSLISHNLMSCKMREMINYCFMCCHTCQSAPALILPSPPHLPLCLTWASPTISRSCSSPLNRCSYLSCSRWAIFRQNGVCCLFLHSPLSWTVGFSSCLHLTSRLVVPWRTCLPYVLYPKTAWFSVPSLEIKHGFISLWVPLRTLTKTKSFQMLECLILSLFGLN